MREQYKGMRIVFFEVIYKRYSELEFTHSTDISLGMAGIETRLARLFGNGRTEHGNGRADYGIFYDPKEYSYLPRTLLWQHANFDNALTKINYPTDRPVPSWSWMAVMGPISFMDIPFAAVRWHRDFVSPFGDSRYSDQNGTTHKSFQDLQGKARDFVAHIGDRTFFDRNADIPTYSILKCVVLGTNTETIGLRQKHYGLLVVPSRDNKYERVGVATFEREQSWVEGPYVKIHIG